jgi:predicted phosphodiesterase
MDHGSVAVFSDVHGNLEALCAALADAKVQGVSSHLFLGDIVGYGPDPAACVEAVRTLGCPVLMGNHEWVTLRCVVETWGNDYVRAGILHARRQLDREAMGWLGTLPMMLEQEDCVFAHASVDSSDPWEYVTAAADVGRQFMIHPAKRIFVGHTHRPALWRLDCEGIREMRAIGRMRLETGCRYLVNGGSVGQPRNQQTKACYAVYRPGDPSIEFRLVRYDFRATQKKIVAAGLPKFLAQRLSLGR